MEKINFDETIEKRNTGSVKWDGLQSLYGSDELIPMWVADMDVRPPHHLTERLTRRAATGHFGYSMFEEEAKQAIQHWFQKRYDVTITTDSILYSSGVVPGLAHTVLALTEPNDQIIIQTPVYPPFHQIIQNNQRQIVENPLLLDGETYRTDFPLLEQQMQTAQMMILCSPHNPSGKVFTQEELQRIVALAKQYDVYLVSDEIHADLVYRGSVHTPILAFDYEKIILVSAPSKTFNIPGLYASYLVVPDTSIRQRIERVQQRHFVHPNALASTAISAAYGDAASEQWLAQLLDYLEENRDHSVHRIRQEMPKLDVVVPESTFLLWIDFKAFELDSKTRADWLVKEAKLALTHGSSFGSGGETFERLNIGCPRAQLDQALDRLSAAYQRFWTN
ncbi:MalY/PatB family protein [uncultured Exiguobacterium sp.]|uniref:MalY/PatB family protein n=1 Tax=uncultured Exiguobacterium sp. TaxID=202669 RepID=UPI0025CF4197|nr:MalY/PatB family protein [uncultured Exiguobacterium sp.]